MQRTCVSARVECFALLERIDKNTLQILAIRTFDSTFARISIKIFMAKHGHALTVLRYLK